MEKMLRWFVLVVTHLTLAHADWVQERLDQMSLEEKVGQLFMIPAAPRLPEHTQALKRFIREYHVGGLIMKQASAKEQVAYLNMLQAQSDLPLLVGLDAEWGLGMRMEGTLNFPRNLTLGALRDPSLLYSMGQIIGASCRAVGGHMNFGPVVDVNSNSQNPIIGMRSFGDDPEEVMRRATFLIDGMQQAGCLAVAKHFPGHGSVDVDSHLDLPMVSEPLDILEKDHLATFQHAIDHGVAGVMTAHLLVPALDSDPTYSSTMSKKIIKGVLLDQMGFDGLVVTDALNMGALTKYHTPEEIALKAYEAGCTILLYGDHRSEGVSEIYEQQVPKAYQALLHAAKTGAIRIDDLNQRVKKVLLAKKRVGIHVNRLLADIEVVEQMINPVSAEGLIKRLYRDAITSIGREGLSKCIQQRKDKVAFISVGNTHLSTYKAQLPSSYPKIEFFSHEELPDDLSEFDQLIVLWENVTNQVAGQFGFSQEHLELIEHLNEQDIPTLHLLMGTPYALKHFDEDASILVAYENVDDSVHALIEILSGRFAPRGKLPVKVEMRKKDQEQEIHLE
ncbi:MAG: Beta-hexosaminidase [Chlamydiia bacterium]|nr:Beta-hexosaminidase [Chlamydiia bacterium]